MKVASGEKLEIDIENDVTKIYAQNASMSLEYSSKKMDSYYVRIKNSVKREDYIKRLSQIDMQIYRTNLDYMFSSLGALGFYISIKNAVKAYHMHESVPFLIFSGVCTFIVVLGIKFTAFNIKSHSEICKANKLIRHEKELLIQILQEFDCEE